MIISNHYHPAHLENIFRDLGKQKLSLCKLFSTDKNYYLYDSGTNKLLKCEFEEYELLKHLLEFGFDDGKIKYLDKHGIIVLEKALKGIEAAIKAEKVLMIDKFNNFGLSCSYDEVVNRIMNRLEMMHLEVTDKCNLNCQYCVYNENTHVEQRKHGDSFMDIQTASAAVDYITAHSVKSEQIGLGFYGGEPILNMPLIHKTVEYAKEVLKKKKINFTMTTNATLITEEIARFFSKENFVIQVSLDGPKHVHDLWRIDRSNKGSYHRTMNGLKKLFKAYKNKEEMIGFSIVYAPLYSEDKLSEMEEFFFQSGEIPRVSNISITYPVGGSIPVDYVLKHGLYENDDYSLTGWSTKQFFHNYPNNLYQNPLAKSIIDKSLVRLIKRPLFDKPPRKIYLNGCCIPASRRLFVTVSGLLKLCERVGDAPAVGHIKEGIDFNTIKKVYLDEYSKNSIEHCSQCWMARLCDICYAQAYTDFSFDSVKKSEICNHKRMSFENQLIFLCSLLEKNNKGLDYLYDYEII